MDIKEQTTRRIQEKVDSGEYADVNEVIERALDALEEVEVSDEELRGKLEAAIAQADRGELIPAEDVFDELQAKYESKRNKLNE